MAVSIQSSLFVVFGLLSLIVGGELLVRGAVSFAERMGVSKLIIGLTIVSLGTSAPELVVCLKAAFAGLPGIALGNVVGSNIANVLLVLGLPAIICPIFCDMTAVRRDGVLMAAASVIFLALCWLGPLGIVHGGIMVILLLGYFLYTYLSLPPGEERRAAIATEEIEHHMPRGGGLSLAFIAIGVVALVVGSRLLVDGAADIARAFGLSDTVIGITLVAVGTSLPELVTTIVAALRRHADVAVGNVIGSNLINILGIMGLTSMVASIDVPAKVLHFDLWVMLACVAVLFAFALRGKAIGRIAGFAFCVLYVGYVWAQFPGISGMPIAELALSRG